MYKRKELKKRKLRKRVVSIIFTLVVIISTMPIMPLRAIMAVAYPSGTSSSDAYPSATSSSDVYPSDIDEFYAMMYDRSARISIPFINNATNYQVYISATINSNLTSLNADSTKRCVFSSETYEPFAYAVDGKKDALDSSSSISMNPQSNYYFYLITNNGVTDSFELVLASKTRDMSNSSWTSPGNYDTGWYDKNPTATTYIISTPEELAGVALLNNGLNGTARVSFFGKTINLTESMDLSAYLWTPIGNPEYPFEGTLDGGNYEGSAYRNSNVISGLHINSPEDYQGLLGYATSTSQVKNIGLVDGYLKGNLFTGGIVGYTEGSLFNCYNTSSIESDYMYVGGIAGYVEFGGDLSNCYNTGSIHSDYSYIGGIVGHSSGNITSCYNTGTIDGNASFVENVGGIAGEMVSYAQNSISLCYNTGDVIGYASVGGIVGKGVDNTFQSCYNTGLISATEKAGGIAGNATYVKLYNCYNRGLVQSDTESGGICGIVTDTDIFYSYNAAPITAVDGNMGPIISQTVTGPYTITDSYYDNEITTSSSMLWIGRSTNDLKNISLTLGWEAWTTAPGAGLYPAGGVFGDTNRVNEGYPVLKAFGYEGGTDIKSQFEIIQEGGIDYYMIRSPYQLDLVRAFSNDAGIHFRMENNLDISPNQYNQLELSWNPITEIAGNFDGNGFSISGLKINYNSENQGLFMYNSGTIENLGMTKVNISCNGIAASIVALSSGEIKHCYSTGLVLGRTLGVSGIAGENTGNISSCSNISTIIGSNYAAGISYKNFLVIRNSSNIGTIKGLYHTLSTHLGGIAGSSSFVISCFNTGVITGDRYIGGITGRNYAPISYCKNTGKITGRVESVGGISGNSHSTEISYCSNVGRVYSGGVYNGGVYGGGMYNDGVSRGVSIGGITGQLTGDGNKITNCYNTGGVAGAQKVAGVVGASMNSIITNCYNIGTISGESSLGGIAGFLTSSIILHAYYSGCNIGVGYKESTQDGSLSFFDVNPSTIIKGDLAAILLREDMNSFTIWNNALGSDFAVSYTGIQSADSGIARISGQTLVGESVNATSLYGTMTVTQNQLDIVNNTGFTGVTKLMTVPIMKALNVVEKTLAIIEKPVIEVPKIEEPKIEEPKIEEPKIEEPKIEEPKIEEPKTEEPKIEEPVNEKPKVEKPKITEPKIEEPIIEEPVLIKPNPETKDPEIKEPGKSIPPTGDTNLMLFYAILAVVAMIVLCGALMVLCKAPKK